MRLLSGKSLQAPQTSHVIRRRLASLKRDTGRLNLVGLLALFFRLLGEYVVGMDNSRASHTVSLITPSYWRDFERCALLCESIDRYVTSFARHYLVVADDDVRLFAKFKSERRPVLPVSEFLPHRLRPPIDSEIDGCLMLAARGRTVSAR